MSERAELEASAKRRGVTLESLLEDYDPRGYGYIKFSELREILSFLNFFSSRERLAELTNGYIENGNFMYRKFLNSGTADGKKKPSVSQKTLLKYARTIRGRGQDVFDIYRPFDMHRFGKVSVLNFLRAWTGDPDVIQEICRAYQEDDQVDYVTLAKDVSKVEEPCVSVTVSEVPQFFSRIIRTLNQYSANDIANVFMDYDRYRRNRITTQDFCEALDTLSAKLSVDEMKQLVAIFSDENGVDWPKFCEVVEQERGKIVTQKSEAEEDLKPSKELLDSLSADFVNRHSQVKAALEDCDPRRTGLVPAVRFFRTLANYNFKLSQREARAIENEFGDDSKNIEYKRFLDQMIPSHQEQRGVRTRLQQFLRTHFLCFRPILEKYDYTRSGKVTVSDLISACHAISFDLDTRDTQELKVKYGNSTRPTVNIDEFLADIDYVAPTTPRAEPELPPAAMMKPKFTEKAARPPPPDEVADGLIEVSRAVRRLQIDLLTDFRAMDTLRQGIVPQFKFARYITNLGVSNSKWSSFYVKGSGIDYMAFIEDINNVQSQKPQIASEEPSAEINQLLLAIKSQLVAKSISSDDVFERFDPGKSYRILKSRVSAALASLGVQCASDQLRRFTDYFTIDRLPEYIGYKKLVDMLDAVQLSEDALKSMRANSAGSSTDRQVILMLNGLRERLYARHKRPVQLFSNCNPAGISPKEFRERLENAGLALREADLQALSRKYRCNMNQDIDWKSFCEDIDASRAFQTVF